MITPENLHTHLFQHDLITGTGWRMWSEVLSSDPETDESPKGRVLAAEYMAQEQITQIEILGGFLSDAPDAVFFQGSSLVVIPAGLHIKKFQLAPFPDPQNKLLGSIVFEEPILVSIESIESGSFSRNDEGKLIENPSSMVIDCSGTFIYKVDFREWLNSTGRGLTQQIHHNTQAALAVLVSATHDNHGFPSAIVQACQGNDFMTNVMKHYCQAVQYAYKSTKVLQELLDSTNLSTSA